MNVKATKVYFSLEEPIHVHQTRVKPCPTEFAPGYYWYGGKRCRPGRPRKRVEATLTEENDITSQSSEPDTDEGTEPAKALHSRTDDSLMDTPFPESDQQPPSSLDLAEDVTGEKEDSEDVSSTGTQPNINKVVENDSPQALLQPTRYSLRMSRRPPERYN